MYARDRLWAWGFVVALWLVVGFVLLSSIPYASTGVTIACWIAAIVLLIFNTGSIANMVRHYGHHATGEHPEQRTACHQTAFERTAHAPQRRQDTYGSGGGQRRVHQFPPDP